MIAASSILRASVVALILTAALSAHASAQPQQMIHGRIVEDRTNNPIEGAKVFLTSAAGRMLDRVQTTNKHGVFIMPVEQGVYKLRIKRLGFDSVDTPILDVKPRANVNVNYKMTPRTVMLTLVEVKPRSGLETGREGMAKREPLGLGKFLYEKDIREIANLPVYEILGRVDGLQTVADGSIRTTRGWGCLQYLVNRLPIMEVADTKIPLDAQFASLYQMLPDGRDIMGVEIYRQFSEVPEVFKHDAWPDDPSQRGVTPVRQIGTRRNMSYMPACGLVNIWTKGAW